MADTHNESMINTTIFITVIKLNVIDDGHLDRRYVQTLRAAFHNGGWSIVEGVDIGEPIVEGIAASVLVASFITKTCGEGRTVK